MRTLVALLCASLMMSFSVKSSADTAFENVLHFASQAEVNLEHEANFYRFLKFYIDNASAVNEKIGLGGTQVTIPKQIAGTVFFALSAPAAVKFTRILGENVDYWTLSSAERAWLREYRAANQSLTSIEKEIFRGLSQADKELVRTRGFETAAATLAEAGDPGTRTLFTQRAAASNQVYALQLTKIKPVNAKLWQNPRTWATQVSKRIPRSVLRGMARTTVVVAGVAIAAGVVGETLVLVFPESADQVSQLIDLKLEQINAELASL